jgi:hypothetical protein
MWAGTAREKHPEDARQSPASGAPGWSIDLGEARLSRKFSILALPVFRFREGSPPITGNARKRARNFPKFSEIFRKISRTC